MTSFPETNVASNTEDCTTLAEEKNVAKIDLLKDIDTLEYGANLTQAIIDTQIQILADYETKSALGLGLWLCHDIKGLSKSQFLPVKPDTFGLDGGDANTKLTHKLRFNLVGDTVWEVDPTYSTDTTYLLTFTVWAGTGTTAVDGATVTIFGGTAVVTDTKRDKHNLH